MVGLATPMSETPPFLSHLSPLLEDPVLKPPAPRSPSPPAVEGGVSQGHGDKACTTPCLQAPLLVPCEHTGLSFLHSEPWKAVGGSVSLTRLIPSITSQACCVKTTASVSGIRFLHSCKLLSDVSGCLCGEGHCSHCPFGKGRHRSNVFPPSKFS